MTNKEISSIFKLTGQLLDLHGENSFRAKSYANASFQIGRLDAQIAELTPEEYVKLKGVGTSNAKKIEHILNTGTFPQLDELLAKTPKGLLEILNIKGLGAKKVRTIWTDLGIEDVGELYYACLENRLAKMKGFGEKTQESVKASIEFYQANKKKFLYARVEQVALGLLDQLKELDAVEQVELTGAIRRKTPVVSSIDFIVTHNEKDLLQDLSGSDFLSEATAEADQISAITPGGIPVKVHLTDTDHFFSKLFQTTGSDQIVETVESKLGGSIHAFPSEQDLFQKAGLPYLVPEVREDENKLTEDFLEALDDLITYEDIRGIVHNHSTYSDGVNSIEEMAAACIERDYEYFGISDHSKSAFYAGGLTEEDIVRQHAEIDRLNDKLSPFKIFKGIESDILNDGSLDYSDSVLKTFDFVVASIHSNLKMDESKAMQRLIKAIEHPYTTILGHMTGRLLLSRPGYPVDHRRIIDACAANEVIIELNANPHRLDIDWRWIGHAIKKGVMISINPDAHVVSGIEDTYYGVCSARKGGLTKAMTFNTRHLKEFESHLQKLKP